MIKTPWRLAGRLLARDWRSGEVLDFAGGARGGRGGDERGDILHGSRAWAVSQQAGEALAADLRVESINPLPQAMREAAMRHGLATSEIVFFRSVVAAGDTTSLADVRGVMPGYPLRGVVQVADSLAGVPENAVGIPARGEVVGRAQPVGAARRRRRRRARGRPPAASCRAHARVPARRRVAPHGDRADGALELRGRPRIRFARAGQYRRVRRALCRRHCGSRSPFAKI